MAAGLVARGSLPFVAFPGPRFPVACDERLTAYSCGGSRGIGKYIPAPHSLLILWMRNRLGHLEVLPGEESILLTRAGTGRPSDAHFDWMRLVPDLNHCMSIAASRNCHLRAMDECSKRHGERGYRGAPALGRDGGAFFPWRCAGAGLAPDRAGRAVAGCRDPCTLSPPA